jgi:hypothetical protein
VVAGPAPGLRRRGRGVGDGARAAGGGRRAAGVGRLPDGALVFPSGGRQAVEVELTDKTRRLAAPGGKLAWYATEEAGYAAVL